MPKVAPRADNSLTRAPRSCQLLEWYMRPSMESWTPLGSALSGEDLWRVVATKLSASAVRFAREQPAEC